VRLEALRRFDAMGDLLTAKDKMIWQLLSDRQAAAADVDAVSAASSSEIAEWKRCV
jgi:hypothetical protein